MLRTISIGSCVSIQGLMVGQLADGKIKIVVDDKTYVGTPVSAMARPSWWTAAQFINKKASGNAGLLF